MFMIPGVEITSMKWEARCGILNSIMWFFLIVLNMIIKYSPRLTSWSWCPRPTRRSWNLGLSQPQACPRPTSPPSVTRNPTPLTPASLQSSSHGTTNNYSSEARDSPHRHLFHRIGCLIIYKLYFVYLPNTNCWTHICDIPFGDGFSIN